MSIFKETSIFGNMYINSEVRLERLEKSLYSVSKLNFKYQIFSFRGIFNKEAKLLTKKYFPDSNLSLGEDNEFWLEKSYQLINRFNSRFWIIFLEDHILLDANHLIDVINDMYLKDLEYCEYSWNFNGNLNKEFEEIEKENLGSSFKISYDFESHTKRNNYCIKKLNQRDGVTIISLPAIFSDRLLKRLLLERKPFWRRHPKNTPFDIEKKSKDIMWLPLNYCLPKKELFCCIDDDNRHPGSSMISRNLYPFSEETKPKISFSKNFYFWISKKFSKTSVVYFLLKYCYRFFKYIKEIIIAIPYQL